MAVGGNPYRFFYVLCRKGNCQALEEFTATNPVNLLVQNFQLGV